MNCIHCKSKVIYLKERLCKDHFLSFYYKRIEKVVDRLDLNNHQFLIGISGGKDSASVAFALSKYTKNFELLYLDLGITKYSEESKIACEALATLLHKKLNIIDFKTDHFTITEAKRQTMCGKLKGSICGTCGLSKRFYLNKYAWEHDFTTVITGHNLDDELAFLMINLKNQDQLQLGRVGPVIKSDQEHKLCCKAKPLYYLTEKENRLFAILNNLPVHPGECPYATDNTQIEMKEYMNLLEEKFPHFKYNVTRSIRQLISNAKEISSAEKEESSIINCPSCGYATIVGREQCRFCQTKEQVLNSTKSPIQAKTDVNSNQP